MIRHILFKASSKLWLVYALLVIEFTIGAYIPKLLGLSIDSLLEKKYDIFTLYVIAVIVQLFVGVARRCFNTRIFSRITLDLKLEKVLQMFSKKVDALKIMPRIRNIPEIVEFAEHTIPHTIECLAYIFVAFTSVYAIFGIKTFLLFGLLILSIFTSKYFADKIEQVYINIQNNSEEQQKHISNYNLNSLRDSYNIQNSLDVKHSDLSAYNWGAIDIFTVSGSLCALLMLVNIKDITVGQITATITYVNMLGFHFQIFPHLIQRIRKIKVSLEFLDKNE